MERAASSDKIMVLIALAGFIKKPRAIATYIDRPLDPLVVESYFRQPWS